MQNERIGSPPYIVNTLLNMQMVRIHGKPSLPMAGSRPSHADGVTST